MSAEPSRCVLVVGPAPSQPGGMAGVVGQMLSLDFGGEFRTVLHAVTASSSENESLVSRCRRHLRQLRSLREAIRHEKAPVVHIHTCSGFSFVRSALDAWVARRKGCRVVLHIHGAAFDEYCRKGSGVRRGLIRRALSATDRVVALSPHWQRIIQEAAPEARVVTIENAVEIPVARSGLRLPGPCRFLLLAKMDEWKGVDDLLNACATLDGTGVPFDLTLAGPAGTAGDAAILGSKIAERELGAAVRYVGPVAGEEKRRLLETTDVCVQPSHHEGMPLAVLEAMAHGLPVIATQVGALPEVIDEGEHGLLVPPGRPDLLAAAMRTLALDTSERERMGRNSRERAAIRFCLTRFRDDVGAMYRGLSAPAAERRGAARHAFARQSIELPAGASVAHST